MPKILIMEDDPSLMKIYKAEFSIRGFEVVSAFDGDEGLKASRENPPDVMLLDLMMPKLSGLVVLEGLKQNTITRTIPVIVVTNFGQEENIRRALELGANEVILKYQVTPAEVVEKAQTLLDQLNEGKEEHRAPDSVS